jgi:predicted short-subunit dehydrogenase-like oxidoreductase (DUF2520 family)
VCNAQFLQQNGIEQFMLSRGMARSVSIVGAGRVGKTLARCLREAGWSIGAIITRSKGTSRAAVRAIGAGVAHAALARELFTSDVILITTPDDALHNVAEQLAKLGGDACRGKTILHTSGALDSTVLAPLRKRGAAVGSLHPMQTFSGKGVPRLAGATFTIEGDAKARHVARQISRDLGGAHVLIKGEHKAAYHAAGALVAGHALALIESAVRILIRAGFERKRAVQTLLPLVRQMLDNFERLGAQGAWTGPLARGDYAVMAKHKTALRQHPREFQEAYMALALLAGEVLSKTPAATKARIKQL